MSLNKIEATTTQCRLESLKWELLNNRELLTCHIEEKTIDDEDFTISSSKNYSTLALKIESKKGVKFLPTNIFDVSPKLEVVRVSDCSVKTVNEKHFEGLSELTIINLVKNNIENIVSDAFGDLVSLKYLYLSFNKIRSLSRSTFSALKALEELSLDSNEIQFLPPEIFKSLVRIKKIELGHNELHYMDDNIFNNLASLTLIDLRDNYLMKIPKKMFISNSKLTKLFLNSNKIKFIDGNTFECLSKLLIVDLSENLCVNKNYSSADLGLIKKDLTESCNEYSAQEKIENAIKALQGKMTALTQELRQVINTEYQTLNDLDVNVTRNIEASNTEPSAIDLNSKLDKKLEEMREALQKEIKESRGDTQRVINTKYKTLCDRFEAFNKSFSTSSSKLFSVEEKLDTAVANLDKKLNEKSKKTIGAFEKKLQNYSNDLIENLKVNISALEQDVKMINESSQASSMFISNSKEAMLYISIFCVVDLIIFLILLVVYLLS